MKCFIPGKLFFVATVLVLVSNIVFAQQDTTLQNTLPKAGQLVQDKPVGKGWINLLSSADDWNFESSFWQLQNNLLHGEMGKEKEHHYSYTKKTYADFELNVLIKMVGDSTANSGVCIHINPTNFDNAQVTRLIWERDTGVVYGKNEELKWYKNFLTLWLQKL
jgi:hypothetical protein